ncbi:hypothetical protein ES708_33072 [subsurface metagenome]
MKNSESYLKDLFNRAGEYNRERRHRYRCQTCQTLEYFLNNTPGTIEEIPPFALAHMLARCSMWGMEIDRAKVYRTPV